MADSYPCPWDCGAEIPAGAGEVVTITHTTSSRPREIPSSRVRRATCPSCHEKVHRADRDDSPWQRNHH